MCNAQGIHGSQPEYPLILSSNERKPNFINQALDAVNGEQGKLVILLCDIGGTLSTFVERKGPKPKKFADPERVFGRASRSLKAAYELQEAGFTDVAYLSGGLKTWLNKDLPSEEANGSQ